MWSVSVVPVLNVPSVLNVLHVVSVQCVVKEASVAIVVHVPTSDIRRITKAARMLSNLAR
jgi:hypothetical protein